MQHNRAPLTFHFKHKPHVLVVEARYYNDIADMQLRGAEAVFQRAGATFEVVTVPGSLEIPAAILFAAEGHKKANLRLFDGYVALGCVIKGGTHHDQIVGVESARGLQELSLRHALAIGNGILTVNNLEQAVERADPARMNRAGDAAEACLRMIELQHRFHLVSDKAGA